MAAGREENGRFGLGNPGGGRPPLPEWFKAKAPDALKHMLAVADGTVDDEKISRMQACVEIVNRVYGHAPKAPEDTDDSARAWGEILSRLRVGEM